MHNLQWPFADWISGLCTWLLRLSKMPNRGSQKWEKRPAGNNSPHSLWSWFRNWNFQIEVHLQSHTHLLYSGVMWPSLLLEGSYCMLLPSQDFYWQWALPSCHRVSKFQSLSRQAVRWWALEILENDFLSRWWQRNTVLLKKNPLPALSFFFPLHILFFFFSVCIAHFWSFKEFACWFAHLNKETSM